ncbi:MAG: site-specific DNA-methyltransferase, partial [Bacteroidales bacterium]|nr:site-specific DNA-methyltransferase [Bacteroidales bacterium]
PKPILTMEKEITSIKKSLIAEINKRVEDRVLEPENAKLLSKLINNADGDTEAISIAALGTTYKRTGFHFDKRIEKISSDIHYLKKNKDLSFFTDENKPVNKLIIGDNYHALQNLLIQYKSKIDIIYIDPPYGKDSMGEFAQTNYQNNITRDNLLSMLYPRLQLAKELLSDSGVIFCSIDDKNQAYVKCLFDEVFGEKNFVGNFIRKTVSQRAMAKSFNNQHDYCLIYAKDKDLFDMVGMEKDFAEYSNPDNDIKGDWKSSDPTMRGSKNNFEIINPITNKIDIPPIGRGWAFTKEVFEEYLRDGKVIFKTECKNNERGFIYKSYKKDKSVFNLINSLEYSSNEFLNQNSSKEVISIFKENVFDYAKPIFFIESLINHSKKTNSIVLDFFAGSGTTGHAVLELNKKDGGNRQFILCQLNEKTDTTPNGIAYDVTSKRLKRIMTGECYDGTKDFKWIEDNEKYGGNLDVYELETVSNKETTTGKSAFEVIDETIYGKEKFGTLKEKIDWVCQNFYRTQTGVESNEQWQKRIKQEK